MTANGIEDDDAQVLAGIGTIEKRSGSKGSNTPQGEKTFRPSPWAGVRSTNDRPHTLRKIVPLEDPFLYTDSDGSIYIGGEGVGIVGKAVSNHPGKVDTRSTTVGPFITERPVSTTQVTL